MVSFSCEACGDVLTKKKLDSHRGRCHGATFTCLDCMVHFPGVQYRAHTACISEDQKYQGALYKDKSKKLKNKPAGPKPGQQSTTMVPQPYVEDVVEDKGYKLWNESAGHTENDQSPTEPPPEALTPPAPAVDEPVNVFNLLVATGQTPNASSLQLPQDQASAEADEASLLHYKRHAHDYLDPSSIMDSDNQPLVEYDSGPVPAASLVTSALKGERRKTKYGETNKDKKRKRLHVDVADQDMTDAPPVLHSGLTGGLKSLLRPALPPSPDYSGGDVADNSPASPLKKTKHTKHAKNGQISNSIFDMITGGAKAKAAHKKKSSKKKQSSHRHREHKQPKLIEFRPQSKDGKKPSHDGQMIIFKPRVDAFLSFVTKGPESERGCSMNKALKRYHRDLQASGSSMAKGKEEKGLWKGLRLRRNERGEIVLFSL